MDPLCAKCQSPFIKETAKFCNKCGTKRATPSAATPSPPPQAAPAAVPRPAPAPAPAPTAASAANATLSASAVMGATSRPTPAPTAASASAAPAVAAAPKSSSSPADYKHHNNASPPPPPSASGNATPTGSSTFTDKISTIKDAVLNTLEEEEVDSAKYNDAMMTLGINGITPEMLQTPNSEELRQYKKGLMLGRGTYGSVYLGLLPDGSFHAVKTVELGGKSGAIQPKELVSLSREINLLRRLKHKNLCSFKGVFYNEENTSVNMFMEYIGGGSMTTVVKNFKPLPPDVVRQWTKQLLTGLLYLHTQRIIHRDIKGENLLIDTTSDPSREAQVKLVDFGAAKRLTDALAQSRTIIGTPYWMAPEIVDLSGEGTGYSYKADVWSVGCTVAEMITGRPPWPAKSNVPLAIMMIAQCEGLPSEMPTEADGATAGCVDFMTKCFTRDPNSRPTVEELLEHPWITGAMV